MNTQKSVFKKLSTIEKVELSEQKVELSLLTDIDRIINKAISDENKLSKLVQSIELDAGKISNDYQVAINLGKDALAKAKELGAENAIRVIQGRISEAEVGKKEMDSIVSKVKSMLI